MAHKIWNFYTGLYDHISSASMVELTLKNTVKQKVTILHSSLAEAFCHLDQISG